MDVNNLLDKINTAADDRDKSKEREIELKKEKISKLISEVKGVT